MATEHERDRTQDGCARCGHPRYLHGPSPSVSWGWQGCIAYTLAWCECRAWVEASNGADASKSR